MGIDERIVRREDEPTTAKFGMCGDEYRHDKGTCLVFRAQEPETMAQTKPVYERMGNESSGDDQNEELTGTTPKDEDLREVVHEVTDQEDVYVDCGRRVVAKERGHYAEILTTEPCSRTISMARRTRESSNPVLRLRYGKHDIFSRDNEEESSESAFTQDDSVLYENIRKRAPKRSKVQYSRSDSEIVYLNTTGDNLAKIVDNSHVYVNCDNRGGNSGHGKNDSINTSDGTSDGESLYEDIDDVYEAMSPATPSKPINIVYTSIDFSSRNASPTSVGTIGSCSISGSLNSLDTSDRPRCASCCSLGLAYPSAKPPELPLRGSNSLSRRARPSSLHLAGDPNPLTEFGLYTGTLVGSCTVMKTSPKSVHNIITDFLAREKKDRSKPVSLEVTNEFIRLSLNCAPWNLLAQNTVDDIGCVTTGCANNKTALGYTVSKPGDDTRCYVVHCSDAEAIKNTILTTFKRPEPTISRWSSMNVLDSTRSRRTRSLPRMRSTPRHNNELVTFNELVYLGSYKAKKSYLVVNDNITSVLDHTDSKHYIYASVELYRDALHLRDSKRDRLLDIHQLEWILSMGLFDDDRRYFGYISSKAFQGSKTRTFCHVFRCNWIGTASMILETIRQACQTTFLAKKPEYLSDFRARANSNTSSSSEGSMSSSSETMSVSSMSSSPPEVDRKLEFLPRERRRPRILMRVKNRSPMSTITSYSKDQNSNDVFEEKDEFEIIPKVSEPTTKASEQRYHVFYLCSTIVSPPLKSKHVKECLKQYQKSVDKAMKKSADNGQHYKKAQLVMNQDGVTIIDDPASPPQAFFPRESISGIQAHPDGKCAFAITTLVSGNTKHKCHLFLQDKDPLGEMIQVIQSLI